MRKLLAICILIIGCSIKVSAGTLGDLGNDIKNNFEVTVLKSATPSYFFEISEQNLEKRHKVGVITSIFAYRFLTADTGWYQSADTARSKGTAVLGGSFHIDRILADAFPMLVLELKTRFPESMDRFWGHLTVGPYLGHSFDTNSTTYGMYSGLEYRF